MDMDQPPPPPRNGTLTERAVVEGSCKFKVFYSNLSSLSAHAKNYIFSLPAEIKLLALLECHNEDVLATQELFRRNGYTASYNPAERANMWNHGGECLATRSYINSRPVSDVLLKSIVEYFMTDLRFAARIVCFKQMEVVFITPYLWVSEGFSQRNQTILRQISMLSK